MSNLPNYLPEYITIKDSKCPKCGMFNQFRWVHHPNEEIRPVCIECTNTQLLDSEEEIQSIDEKLKKLVERYRNKLKLYNRNQLLKYILQMQEYLGEEGRKQSKLRFQVIQNIKDLIQETFRYANNDGKTPNPSVFREIWDVLISINNFLFLRSNLFHKTVFLDKERNEYYTYRYIRRMDGMSEFGVGRSSQIRKFLEEYGSLYRKELKKAIESLNNRSFLEALKVEEVDEVEFVSAFYCVIQSHKVDINKLNLQWIRESEINIEKLSEWRKRTFLKEEICVESERITETLYEVFGYDSSNKIYQNLITSSKHPNNLPYGVEIKNKVYISPNWAFFIELLLFAEAHGKEIFERVQYSQSQLFEKHRVPEILKQLGVAFCSGHKETEKGIIIFEIDLFILDKNGTLWVTEIKSQKIHKRFMESYLSWEQKCKDFINKPKKQKDYREILQIVKNKIDHYQQNNTIPRDWIVNDVKGLILSQLPPFNYEYRGIFLVWYRELADFFTLYYNNLQ